MSNEYATNGTERSYGEIFQLAMPAFEGGLNRNMNWTAQCVCRGVSPTWPYELISELRQSTIAVHNYPVLR